MKVLPKEFCIKCAPENPLWQKYVKWLNEKFQKDYEGIHVDIKYGVIGQSTFSSYLGDPSPIEITLEDWNEAVEKYPLPKPVFTTNSGIEIYDEVKMVVWDKEHSIPVIRKVIARTESNWVTLSEAGSFVNIKNAHPMPKKISVSLAEIAAWKGVDKEQIELLYK